MAETHAAPPDCGKRLLPALVDEIAANEPGRIFASVPETVDIADGFTDISYHGFARAVNRCAYWLVHELGECTKQKTILYMGPLDLRYLIIILAVAKSGHIVSMGRMLQALMLTVALQVFFSSHRNSLEAHLSLLENSGCQTILLPSRAPTITKQILEKRPMETVYMPELDFFMNDFDIVETFPFRLTWEEAKDKPFCVLHTSGSTGTPKPVFVTYGTFACNDAHQLIPTLGGKATLIDFLKGKRFFLALPLFHAACLTFSLGFNVFAGVTCVLPPPEPLTASLANQIFTHGNLDGALLAPSLIVDCYNNDQFCVNMVQRLKFLAYVGGTLPEEIGNPLSTRLKLMTLMGSCETALQPLEINDNPSDWQYLTISPFLGHTFRLERDGLYDLVIVRQERYEVFQGVFSTFPGKQEFAMGDLFEPHPQKPESWVFRTRVDDIIAFTTAEKLNPTTMESVISANAKVKSAVIAGQGQFQASLLIEPRIYPTTAADEEQLVKDIWQNIAQANRGCPAHGRIMKGFVLLTNPDKPMPRAGKDTVQRHAVLKLYAEEIKALYDRTKTHSNSASRNDSGVSQAPQKTSKQNIAAKGPTAQTLAAPAASLPNVSETHVPADLNARIEEILIRILPEALRQHLPKALAEIMSNLLSTGSSIQAPIQSSKTSTSSLDRYLPQTHNSAEATEKAPATTLPSESTQTDCLNLRRLIYNTLHDDLVIENVTDDSDLFQCGLDSVQLPSLLQVLNAFLIKSRPGVNLVSAKNVYDNPTVRQIVALVG